MSIKFKVVSLLIIVITILLTFESVTCGQEVSFSSDRPLATKSDINSKSPENFIEIDMHALNAPESAEKSIESLAAYLTGPAKNDTQKARAIYRWIAENIDYDVQGLSQGRYGDTSAEGVLKRGKSVCGGYSNLFKGLANASGLETVVIGGYSKYNYTPGMSFSDPDHAWNAVKIDEKWYLIDSTWGAGNVENGKFNRKFEDYFFLTPPVEFVYSHLPEDSMWQLLDEPISKEEFEDLVYLMPTFFDFGMKLGNKKNITIISNGQVNLTLYTPQDISLIAKLEPLSMGASYRRVYGSSTFVKRSGEQYIIELLPPFPGEYILRVYGIRGPDSNGVFEEILKYNVVELSGSNRSFPIVSDEFFDLGFQMDNKTNGTIVVDGEANLTLSVPADVLMIASLEKPGQSGSSSKDYSNSIFVQRAEDQYEISLSPPTAGEYILNIFAKQMGDSSNSYSGVMKFNVSALSGSNQSFPETFGGFQEMGVYLFIPLTGEVKAGSNQTFKIKNPDAEEVVVISDDSWNSLTKNGDIFQGNATLKKGNVDVAVKLSGTSDYSSIIRYRAT